MEVTGSRQLLGPSLWLDGTGVVADVRLAEGDADPVPPWREALKRANATLGWPRRVHSRRTGDDFIALAVEAPPDCLSGAARLNDWAVAGGPEEELPSLVQRIAASSRPDQRAAIAQAGAARPAVVTGPGGAHRRAGSRSRDGRGTKREQG